MVTPASNYEFYKRVQKHPLTALRRIWDVYGWLLNEWAFLNDSHAYRSRGYRKYDRLCRAHGRGGRSEHWDYSPDFR